MSTPDSNHIRRTLLALASSAAQFSLPAVDAAACKCSMEDGFREYGAGNHVSASYDCIAELLEELRDSFEQAGGIGPSRRALALEGQLGERDLAFGGDNPTWQKLMGHIVSAIRLAHEIERQCRDAGPDWACYAPTQRKCHRCEGQCFTE